MGSHFFVHCSACGARHHRLTATILDTITVSPFLYEKESNYLAANMSSDVETFPHMQPSPAGEPSEQPASSPTSTVSVGTKRKKSADSSKAPQRKKRTSSSDDEPSQSNSDEDGDPADEKKSKRQQRLLKNREAAQQFRQRQKNYIQELEKKVDSLVSENQQFTSKAELLQSENHLLRDQLSYLRGFMGHVMSAFSNKVPGAPDGMPAMGPAAPSPFSFASPIPTPPMTPTDAGGYGVPNQRLPMYQSNPASVAAAFQAAIGLAPSGPSYDPRHINRSDRRNSGDHQ